MDTSDPAITFDLNGECDHCSGYDENVAPIWSIESARSEQFEEIVLQIKAAGRAKPFDCIIGMSGGLDSSYMLHLAVSKYGLRPLVFHVDGGWNTEFAVKNIQVMVEKLSLEIYTEVVNWAEMKDFQLAFFKSGVSHLDIPQDHAFVATLYHFADKYHVGYILNGGNYSTECVRNPLDWLYHGTDMAQLRDIHRRFGTRPLKTYPFSSILYHKLYLRYVKGVKVVKPLNYLPYTKKSAIETLSKEYGWTPYPQKHFESRFTRFFESYWLPTRFGYDTRRVQYSSLILTGQMARNEALEALKRPAYDPETIGQDFEYIADKLEISTDELRSYHQMPLKTFRDYKNQEWLFNIGSKILHFIGVEKSVKR